MKKKTNDNAHEGETLIETEEVISDDFDITHTFNGLFLTIVPNLKKSRKETLETNLDEIDHPSKIIQVL